MKFFYYFFQWTWGLPMSLIGAIVFLICKLCRCQTYKYRNAYCIVVPWNFGGLELGMFFMRGKDCHSVCAHEYGHSIQNLFFGWLMPFIVCIPSAIRYWYREFRDAIHKPCKTGYYDIWFERQASNLGDSANEEKWSWL